MSTKQRHANFHRDIHANLRRNQVRSVLVQRQDISSRNIVCVRYSHTHAESREPLSFKRMPDIRLPGPRCARLTFETHFPIFVCKFPFVYSFQHFCQIGRNAQRRRRKRTFCFCSGKSKTFANEPIYLLIYFRLVSSFLLSLVLFLLLLMVSFDFVGSVVRFVSFVLSFVRSMREDGSSY